MTATSHLITNSDCGSSNNTPEQTTPAYLGPPADCDQPFPFFSYGLFQPGELAYGQLHELVKHDEEASRKGTLRLRDGLPILKQCSESTVVGTLLYFTDHVTAYKIIGCFEPGHHYCWKRLTLESPIVEANVCVGEKPGQGSVEFEGNRWSGKDDPILTHGFQSVITAALAHAEKPFESAPEKSFEWDRFFQIEMAYLLLWSCIERFSALACGPWKEPTKRVTELSNKYSVLLKEELRTIKGNPRKVVDSRRPDGNSKLDFEDPKKAFKYYYQVRCNLAHRGKGVSQDGETLRLSLCELTIIFRALLSSQSFAPPDTERLKQYLTLNTAS